VATTESKGRITIIPTEEVEEALRALETLSGHPRNKDATADRVREMMRAEGINPEDNELSRYIIRARRGH
jgi:hypothetical protein